MKIKELKNKKERLILVIFISFALIFNLASSSRVVAENKVRVFYNDSEILYTLNNGTPFIDSADRTQVPFRKTLETIGATVSWNQQTQVATATRGDIRVDIPIGEKYILKNGEKILNDTASIIINQRTFLPIRIVLEAFECDVIWNQETATVYISYIEENTFIRIPSSYDLRTYGKVTSIKDQFNTGACWAFASFGALESSLMPGENYDFSEDHLSLGHGFNLSQAKGGNYMITLSYMTRWSGPVLEVDDPFNDGRNNPEAKTVKHLQEAQFIPTKDYSGIKLSIMRHGGVQTSIHATDLTFQTNTDYYNTTNHSYYYNGNQSINHDVVIIGWDDRYAKENFNMMPKKDGAFIVKNSYGTEFGDSGYFYISYEDKNIGTQNIVYTRVDGAYNYDVIYQSDWLGFVGQIGYGEDTAYFSNVYTSGEKELLKAVSFYATGPRSNYEIYVVPKYNSVNSFQEKQLMKRGSVDFGGYYTVDFDNPIEVDGAFAVVVKIITPGSEYPVAAEFKKDIPWIGNVDITDGIGYMSYDGVTWDRTEEVLEANVCLKAFTIKYDFALGAQD